MGTDGEDAGGDTPRWRDLGDSRDLAAAVRSAYQSSPREGATVTGLGPTPPTEPVDALALLRSAAPSPRAVAPRRVVTVVSAIALVVGAAVAPVAILTRDPAPPSMTPIDPTVGPGEATPTTAASEPWTYEPAPPTTAAADTTTTAPATATTAVARTATTTRARRSTATTRATSAPANSPPATEAPPANDEPTSGW